MKKIFAMLLALLLIGSYVYAEETDVTDASDIWENEADDIVEYEEDYSMEVEYAWPSTLSGMPVYQADSYESWITDHAVLVYMPAGADANFADYKQQLTDMGASLYVDNELLTVLVLGDMEIHLLPDAEEPSIAFYAEEAYEYEEDIDLYPDLVEYPLPEKGTIVTMEGSYDYTTDAETGEIVETMESMLVIVRCASISDCLDYCDQLTMAGWIQEDSPTPDGNTLFTTFIHADRRIMIDYYANSSDYVLYFDYNEY